MRTKQKPHNTQTKNGKEKRQTAVKSARREIGKKKGWGN